MSSLYNDTTYNYNAWTNPGFTGAAGFVEAGYYGGTNGAGQPAGTRRTLTNVAAVGLPGWQLQRLHQLHPARQRDAATRGAVTRDLN